MLHDFTEEKTYAATRIPVGQAQTLIPDAYRSQDFFNLEASLVFEKSWVCVGYTSQVKEIGSTLLSTVAGQAIFVIRDRDQQLRCFYNVCRHRGSQLLAEEGRVDMIRCPYHSWTYSTSGTLMGTPYFKGTDLPECEKKYYQDSVSHHFCKKDYSLLSVNIDTWGCLIFVNLDPQARPLQEWLGDLPERYARYPLSDLELFNRKTYEVQSNWKLIAENFMEYYHVPFIHPELNRVSKGNHHYRRQGTGMYMGFCTSPLTKDPKSPFDAVTPMPGINSIEAEAAYWIHIFPNVSLFLLPNHLFTLILKPSGPNLTIEHTDLLVHPSALAQEGNRSHFEEIFMYWDHVNRQDFEAVQKVQIGISSKAYPGGRLCERYEEPIHRFQNMLIDRMIGLNRIPLGDHPVEHTLLQKIQVNTIGFSEQRERQ
jgi:phenylpropionate dioxygenase-like ring-hydroxylating dioxygenase large terminal subunit